MKIPLTVMTKNLSVVLCYLLLLQLAAPPAMPQELLPEKISLVVQTGEGVINNVGSRTASPLVVEVQDEKQRPVSGAAVVFILPTEGPSGEFPNGAKSTTVFTDNQGKATAPAFKVNQASGKLQIHVNASYRGLRASTTVTEFNMAVPGKSRGGSGKLIAILVLIGAGAAGGAAYAVTRKSGSSPTSATPVITPISITPGSGTVGAPH